ncbi:MAG: hypothetical protein CM15mV144_180 [Caudoviricetes sp.]|nr:MAG: hypothetical protein CM15mV144_180 [Caudoviricetes sp.]
MRLVSSKLIDQNQLVCVMSYPQSLCVLLTMLYETDYLPFAQKGKRFRYLLFSERRL